jgi:hypothetical protein
MNDDAVVLETAEPHARVKIRRLCSVISGMGSDSATNIEYRPHMPVAPERERTARRAGGDLRRAVEQKRQPLRVLIDVRRTTHQERNRLGNRHRIHRFAIALLESHHRAATPSVRR